MRTAVVLWVVALLVLAGPARGSEKEAKEILERAIKAHGGTSALTRAAQVKRTDTGSIWVGGRKLSLTVQVIRSLPDKLRLTIGVGSGVKSVLVMDGEKGWYSDGGPAVPLMAPKMKELREETYVFYATTLVPLTKEGYTLSTLPRTKVDGEAAVGIKVARKGYLDLRLYFLQRNGLLVRVEREATLAGVKVAKESRYSTFKSFDGVKLPTRETEYVNGNKSTEITISDVSFPAKLDAKTFAKP